MSITVRLTNTGFSRQFFMAYLISTNITDLINCFFSLNKSTYLFHVSCFNVIISVLNKPANLLTVWDIPRGTPCIYGNRSYVLDDREIGVRFYLTTPKPALRAAHLPSQWAPSAVLRA